MTRGKSPGHWNVTFRDTADKAGTRVTMADEDAQVFLGEGPVPGRGGDRVAAVRAPLSLQAHLASRRVRLQAPYHLQYGCREEAPRRLSGRPQASRTGIPGSLV